MTGKYEDVKVPGILFDVISLEAMQRYISDLHRCLNGGKKSLRRAHAGHENYNRFQQHWYERSPRTANFSNVWSFLPEQKKTFNRGNFHHTTIKPILLAMRLVEMLTPENGSILDFFSGSGTTAIACQRLNREFVCIEKEQEYYEHSVERLEGDVWQPELDLNMN